jgi:hypothetical protein
MNIDTNLSSMLSIQMQVNQYAQNIAQVVNEVGDPELQTVGQDLVDSIVMQDPQVIAYQANAKGIETQQAVMDILLDIKA